MNKEFCTQKDLGRIEQLKNVLQGKQVTILGHDNIDVDAFLSGVLMSKLLDFLGIENQFIINEEVINNETYEIVTDLIEIDMKKWQKTGEDTERNLFLVDHYKTKNHGTVLGISDHHSTTEEHNYSFKYVRNSCSTSYLIYELMKEAGYSLKKDEATMIIVAMMVDTTGFKSSKTIEEEVIVAQEIATQFELDYHYLRKYCLCLTPIHKMTVEDVIRNGQKKYDFGGKQVASAYLQLCGYPKKVQLLCWAEKILKLEKAKFDMYVFIIFDVGNNKTTQYQFMDDCIKAVTVDGILSRGKDITPKIEARYLTQEENKIAAIVEKFAKANKTIATMESCTGGYIVNQITNILGASEMLKESYVAYSNLAKIRLGVPQEVIDKYTVYSTETAIAMAKVAVSF